MSNEQLIIRIKQLETLLRECLTDYDDPRYTDRYGMADRIKRTLYEF